MKYGELTLTTTGENLVALLTFLRDDAKCGFVNLIDICGVDWPQASCVSTSSITFCRRR